APHHPLGSEYSVFRDAKDFGAKGDGLADDTDAINRAISHGGRCGGGDPGNDSSTISPALVYFPSGIYRITRPIMSYYYTSLVGDAVDRPILKADEAFQGLAVIDENPYLAGGRNWFTNQNNFFRSVAHLIIDMTAVSPATECAGIHHQVAQATGLRHVHFELRRWSKDSPDAGQRGIFMENGSGGHMSDLSFRGGKQGMWVGNQQFTIQRCRFDECATAISQHWCWNFLYSRIQINDCKVGLEMRVEAVDGKGESAQGAASIVCTDWKVSNTRIAFDIVGQGTPSRGSLALSNVETERCQTIVARSIRQWEPMQSGSGVVALLLPGINEKITVTDWTWQGDSAPTKPSAPRTGSLLLPRPCDMTDRVGQWLHQSRPEYLDLEAMHFISLKDEGAKGDGAADDTAAFQAAVRRSAQEGKVLYVPHGQYLLTSTVVIPPGCRIVGEVWPVFLGTGRNFSDGNHPRAVVQVGESDGQEGHVEISECIFSTKGPSAGAIVLQWQLRGRPRDDDDAVLPGMWDTHIRLGGFRGSDLDDERFDSERPLDLSNGWACFLAFHLTRRSSGCFVNNWVWLADHILDTSWPDRHAGKQISLLASRGILIESNPGPVMLWGGASEHFLLYQYQLNRAKNVLIAHSQTESPYFLGEHCALPQTIARPKVDWCDPTWEESDPGLGDSFKSRSWGIRIMDSTSIHLFAAGLYSFFDAYSQDRLSARRCQEALLSIEGCALQPNSDEGINIVGLNTVGTESMVVVDGKKVVDEIMFRNGFSSTLGYYFAS
ncbi:pectin lyase-like protein, partial [Microstroma glucosiphilum]